jgi:hypothetical protein
LQRTTATGKAKSTTMARPTVFLTLYSVVGRSASQSVPISMRARLATTIARIEDDVRHRSDSFVRMMRSRELVAIVDLGAGGDLAFPPHRQNVCSHALALSMLSSPSSRSSRSSLARHERGARRRGCHRVTGGHATRHRGGRSARSAAPGTVDDARPP